MNIRPKASLNGTTGTGLLKGEPGDNGATFTPILDGEGNLSWSNDKGLPNPEPVNIRGPKGDPSASPSSGFVTQDTAPEDTNLMWVDTSDDTEESPDGIVDAIPAPTTASVGQTIVVKSVDENGKPTEWEAVDMPSGGDVSDEGVVLLAETDALTENSTSIGITGLNLTEKSYVFRVTGTQDKIGNGLDIVINGQVFWNYTGPGKDVFVGFGLVNSEWILKVYMNPILDRSHRHVVTKFSGVLNSVELKPHYASDSCYINSGSKLMIYSGLFDAVLLAE